MTDTKPKQRHRSAKANSNVRDIDYGLTESRNIPLKYELRGGKGSEIILTGRAMNHSNDYTVYDSLGSFQERTHFPVLRNAETSGCVFLINHSGTAFGRTSNHMLQLEETSQGLNWQLTLDGRSQAHNDLAVSIERLDLPECSVGFSVARDKWSTNQQHRDIYGLRELYDVSVVNNAANTQTEAHVEGQVARVLAIADAEVRSGKRISKSTAARLQSAKAALGAAGLMHSAAVDHIDDLLSLPGDGTTSGGGANGGGSGPGLGNQDGSGSRSVANDPEFRRWIRKQQKRKSNAIIERATKAAHESHIDITT